MESHEVLEELVKIFGPTGYEKLVQQYFSEIMKPLVDKVYSDEIGNCYAEVSGDDKLPKIMMNAHADSIGFIVKHIDDRGFVFPMDITGFPTNDYQTLPGTSVLIHGRHKNKFVKGHFIPAVPSHHKEDLDETIDRSRLMIDLGVRGKQFTEEGKNAVEKHITKGDYVAMVTEPRYHQLNPELFISANLDDRVGLYCMYRIAKAVKNMNTKKRAPIVFASTVREEDWSGGAEVAARLTSPKYSITFDVTPATDTIRADNEDFIAQKYGNTELNFGPSIPRGMGVYDDLFLFLEKLCRRGVNPKFKIPYQVSIDDSGVAENLQILPSGKCGVKAAGIYVPCRNTHSTIETVSLRDVEKTVRLGIEFYRQASLGNINL